MRGPSVFVGAPSCEDAERFVEEVREDDTALAELLSVEPVEFEA
jgi:hypothetical protein